MFGLLTTAAAGSSGQDATKSAELYPNAALALQPLFPPDFGLAQLTLLETIGTGSFGRVRLVKLGEDQAQSHGLSHNQSHSKVYALKMMKKGRIVKAHALSHIHDEVRLLARLNMTFIVKMHAFFQDEYSVYLLLDYLPGGELFSHLRLKGKFDKKLYLFYAVEVACALHYLHRLEIVYRDLRPENIVLSKEGHIRLVDFGLAKPLPGGSGTGGRTFTVCGVPEYAAPELLLGQGAGTAVDWWALGILIFEMACGYPPFFGPTPFVVYQAIIANQPPFPAAPNGPDVSTQAVARALLHSDRAKRLGADARGFVGLQTHPFFGGMDWASAAKELVSPPAVPTVSGEDDTSNFDMFPDEGDEEIVHLSTEERAQFAEFDRILERHLNF